MENIEPTDKNIIAEQNQRKLNVQKKRFFSLRYPTGVPYNMVDHRTGLLREDAPLEVHQRHTHIISEEEMQLMESSTKFVPWIDRNNNKPPLLYKPKQ